MPSYKSYPNNKNTPNRKTRKGMRRTVFLANSKMNSKAIKRQARLAK